MKVDALHADLSHGIRSNLSQFLHQLFQVFLVGLTIGMMRNVVPALATQEFGVPQGSFTLLAAFVVAFGFVKGTMNFVAGRLSEWLGRRKVLLIGWLTALPIPFLILYGPSWNWIVAATVLLGINQGLTWSMALTAKLDLTRPEQKGLVNGLNEFSGYFAVAVAGVITGYLASGMGARQGLFMFGAVVILLAITLVLLWVRDTLPWARAESARFAAGTATGPRARFPQNISDKPSTWEVFSLMSWRDRRMFALCQAGLVEKFTDALVWVFYPVFLHGQGLSLPQVGWVVGVYGTIWGASQLVTGPLSDLIGRHKPIVAGMLLCGIGVGLMLMGSGMLWWSFSAAITGFGMALLYPTLGASVADIAHPDWRGSALGIYRFWRDLGYGFGALGLGIAAQSTGQLTAAFWFVAISMILSGLLLAWLGEETHPRLNPASAQKTSQ